MLKQLSERNRKTLLMIVTNGGGRGKCLWHHVRRSVGMMRMDTFRVVVAELVEAGLMRVADDGWEQKTDVQLKKDRTMEVVITPRGLLAIWEGEYETRSEVQTVNDVCGRVLEVAKLITRTAGKIV